MSILWGHKLQPGLFLMSWLALLYIVTLPLNSKFIVSHATSVLPVCLSFQLSACLPVYLSFSMYVSFHLSVCLSMYLSVCFSICLSVCLSSYLSVSLSHTFMSACFNMWYTYSLECCYFKFTLLLNHGHVHNHPYTVIFMPMFVYLQNMWLVLNSILF